MILAGDIGGTKTILALYEVEGGNWRCAKKEQFSSSAYQAFNEILDLFLGDVEQIQVSAACIGVAGPIVDGNCSTTNLPWVLNQTKIGAQLHTRNVKLLNDLESTAWGVLELPEHNFVELNSRAEPQEGNIAILAAGTGLGESIITWDGTKYYVMATEGGHADFAPGTEQEIALLHYLREKYPEHVSYERLLSGEGLINIYQFLKKNGWAAAQSEIEQQMTKRDPAAVIGEAGVAGSDALCVEALNIFCRIYGAESGNLALKCLPYAGIYLAGGIASKILSFLQKETFMQGFLAKGRYRPVLEKISVKVCTNPEAALLGAASYAIKQL
ncbi:glucokinase [Methylobacter sp.]|uniref:glucokinase n=1 Tax=Methylobacter sp. TaxID=2051955 RepID=UPI003DA60E17